MIVLMRHAQTMGGTGRCIGRTPVPLSEQGAEQARQLAEILNDIGLVKLYSSPSKRALGTVAPLAEALGLGVDVLPELDEIDMGVWDGLTFDEIRSRYPEEFAERGGRFAGYRPEGGESFSDVADRALGVLGELAAGPGSVLAVTHAGVIRSVLCRVTSHPMDDVFHFSPGYMECTVLRPARAGLELVATGISPAGLSSFL